MISEDRAGTAELDKSERSAGLDMDAGVGLTRSVPVGSRFLGSITTSGFGNDVSTEDKFPASVGAGVEMDVGSSTVGVLAPRGFRRRRRANRRRPAAGSELVKGDCVIGGVGGMDGGSTLGSGFGECWESRRACMILESDDGPPDVDNCTGSGLLPALDPGTTSDGSGRLALEDARDEIYSSSETTSEESSGV